MRVLALLLVLLAPALAACSDGGAPADQAARTVAQEEARAVTEWRTAIEGELGTDAFDFDAIRADAARDCLRTDVPSWTVELALSGDLATSGLTRIGLQHACPDALAAFDEAVTAVGKAADPLDLVCGPGVRLSPEDRLKADLVCANRAG